MAERSFAREVQALKLGDGETFRGEGILAVTKALLQSGVAYVGGYQGAPVSHLLDVLVDAEDMMADLGVHLETCTNEASAAAMLGASINYPLRGAVTWKSIVGTNVAADALSNLASPGVIGGVMIILGEDYGEGASVIQERSYAYAMKSSIWLLDPRPDLPTIVRMAAKGAGLGMREGAPAEAEQMVNVGLRRADMTTRVFGKGVLPRAGEYTSDVLINGLASFLEQTRPAGIDADATATRAQRMLAHKSAAGVALGDIPPRPPNFCTGCPARPVFSAIKLMQRELGPTHISADIGCHSFATFAPFSLGNYILGYGMSLASAAAVTPNLERRPIAVMGDGGFWHNGLITGVTSNLFNGGDGVLIVMQNGYTSATGLQYMPSSKASRQGAAPGMDIEQTLRSLGVKWLRKVRSYSVGTMAKTLKEAMRTAERGLKVIIADGECQLARQRRVRAEDAARLARGARVVRTRFGVDDEICTGDHSCIRLSGCPSLTVKPNPDPLRTDPVATVIESCVGCGLCGEVAHAAVLCPSFYRAEIIRNPNFFDRLLFAWRNRVIGWLGGRVAEARR